MTKIFVLNISSYVPHFSGLTLLVRHPACKSSATTIPKSSLLGTVVAELPNLEYNSGKTGRLNKNRGVWVCTFSGESSEPCKPLCVRHCLQNPSRRSGAAKRLISMDGVRVIKSSSQHLNMASGIDIYSFFSDIQNSYFGYPKKLFWISKISLYFGYRK